MSDNSTGTKDLPPHFEDIQAHYDLSDDFFGVFQDPTRKYSCAYFTGPERHAVGGADRRRRPEPRQARPQARDDAAGDRLRLGPDAAAGDGALRRQRHRPDAVEEPEGVLRPAAGEGRQRSQVRRAAGGLGAVPPARSTGSCRSRRSSTSASSATTTYFKNCFDILPDDGRMTIQSSVGYHPYDLADRGKKLTFELARFIKFMITEIFPGGRIPTTQMMIDHGEKAGFVVPETHVVADALHQDARHLGRRARDAQGRGHRSHRRGELPPVHEVPEGLPVLLHRREHRRQPGDLPEAGRGRIVPSLRVGPAPKQIPRP